MAFNPFAHMDELVASNIFGGPLFGLAWQDTVTLPSGQVVPSAVPGHPDSVTFWLPTNGVYHEITPDQAFAQSLWLHAAYGVPLIDFNSPTDQTLGFGDPTYHLTDAGLKTAILGMPELVAKIEAAGVTEQQVYDYAHANAPTIMLVGQPG